MLVENEGARLRCDWSGRVLFSEESSSKNEEEVEGEAHPSEEKRRKTTPPIDLVGVSQACVFHSISVLFEGTQGEWGAGPESVRFGGHRRRERGRERETLLRCLLAKVQVNSEEERNRGDRGESGELRTNEFLS